ncbi:unnamed protein product [Gongylonema pulchrum]|uniref:Uncharacterized protein n=1 Tax=Gongylonema pulchrum TaxID=637853 RepID=A0A183ESQ0_9BILA|nr:unnamed protein product [Gongylonema pulchrum]
MVPTVTPGLAYAPAMSTLHSFKTDAFTRSSFSPILVEAGSWTSLSSRCDTKQHTQQALLADPVQSTRATVL